MKNKTKIIFLITGLGTGGAEMVIYRLLKTAIKQDYADKLEFKVISIVPPAEIGEKIKELGIEVLSLNAESKLNPLIPYRLYSILKKEKPDILHTFLFHANFLGRIVGKIAKVPTIISAIRNEYFGSKLREFLIKRTKNWCDHTTVVSQYTADKMVKKGVIAKDKYKVITNGVDTQNLTKIDKKEKEKIKEDLNLKKKSPVLIGVGSLTKQKGFSYLIKAIKILKQEHPDILLIILGEGSERKKLEKLIKKLNLKDNVKLLGRKDNVKDYLQLADIFVLSSLWEGMPNVLLEAQAVGLPSIATNVSGVSEIIKNNKSGITIKPKDEEAISTAVKKLINKTKKEKQETRKISKENIRNNFSTQTMTNQYLDLYNKFN